MLIRVKETQKEYKVRLCAWEYDEWQPSCFNDMEVNVPINYPQVEGSNAYEMPQKDFDDLIGYWESECNDFNEGRWSEQFGDREEVESEIGHERKFELFVDEQ